MILNQKNMINKIPSLSYHFENRVRKVVKEVVHIGCAIAVLDQIYVQLSRQCPVLSNHLFKSVVEAPFLEEVLFRLALQNGIHGCQKLKNWIFKKKLNEADLRIQKIFRVECTSILFALSHFNVSSISFSLTQMGLSYVGGSSLGYLYEKYGTLSVPILLHGCNNALEAYALIAKLKPILAIGKITQIGKFVFRFSLFGWARI